MATNLDNILWKQQPPNPSFSDTITIPRLPEDTYEGPPEVYGLVANYGEVKWSKSWGMGHCYFTASSGTTQWKVSFYFPYNLRLFAMARYSLINPEYGENLIECLGAYLGEQIGDNGSRAFPCSAYVIGSSYPQGSNFSFVKGGWDETSHGLFFYNTDAISPSAKILSSEFDIPIDGNVKFYGE